MFTGNRQNTNVIPVNCAEKRYFKGEWSVLVIPHANLNGEPIAI